MSRIHPTDKRCQDHALLVEKEKQQLVDHGKPCRLTVWKRSSMSFQGTDGFTVFDPKGRLVFRVDNYSRKNRFVGGGGGLVLMDGVGNALLTLKPQLMSMQYQWNAYRGDDGWGQNPRTKVFLMKSSWVPFHSSTKHVAEIFIGGETSPGQKPDFLVEGSFRARDCKVKTPEGEVVAKMARKRANTTILLSDDVFSLVVQPDFDAQLVMGFVIVLDRISNKPFAPVLCS